MTFNDVFSLIILVRSGGFRSLDLPFFFFKDENFALVTYCECANGDGGF